jgi:hypothetical protein
LTKHTISRAAAIIIAFVALFTNTGCKESAILNTNITPAGDSLIIEGEDVPIAFKTVSVNYNTGILTDVVVHGVGFISNDPEVGTMFSSLYMQVVPPQSSGYTLPANIDSFVLILPYIGFTYGDSAFSNTTGQTYSAYFAENAMTHGAVYYNTDSVLASTTSLGSVTVTNSQMRDSVNAEGGKQIPHLRIKLDSAAMYSKLNGASYSDYASFLNSFYGFKIAVTGGGNNTVPYFRLSSDGSTSDYASAAVLVYYHDINEPTVAKKNIFSFNKDNCAHFNNIKTDISGSNAANPGNEFVYLQGRPGLALEVSTTNLKNTKNKVVNKAEIVITQVKETNDDKFAAPVIIIPYRDRDTVTASGVDTFLNVEDFVFTSSTGNQVSGASFIGGTKRNVTIDGEPYNQWVINIPKELQVALKNNKEMKLLITGANLGYIGAFRLKGYGNNADPRLKIRLNVVYSKL